MKPKVSYNEGEHVSDSSEEEANLLGVWHVLIRWKMLLFGVAFAVWIVSAVYAFFAVPVYRVEAILLPPTEKAMQGLNYTPQKVYGRFVQKLRSISLRKRFFSEYGLLEHLTPVQKPSVDASEVFEDKFNKILAVIWDKNKNRVSVSFEGLDAGLAAHWVNDFVALASKETITALIRDVGTSKMKLRKEITAKIEFKLSYKIAQLKSAIRIASRLGIVNPYDVIRGVGQRKGGLGNSTVMGNIVGQPVYMRGTRALKEEMREVERQEANLREKGSQQGNNGRLAIPVNILQEKLFELERVSVVSVMQVDQAATASAHPFKPQRWHVVFNGLFIGLGLGVCAAFLADFLGNARRRKIE